MKNPYEKIIHFFQLHNIHYEEIHHEPIFTMEQTKNIPGISLHEGIKSLLLHINSGFVLIVLSGIQRLHSKKLKKILRVKDLRFATPDEVKEIMGCEIGACYPLGNLLSLPLYVDERIQTNKIISFTPGIHTKTVKIQWGDYNRYVKPVITDISE